MKKYFTHLGSTMAVVALSLMALSCGDREKKEDADSGGDDKKGSASAKGGGEDTPKPSKGTDKPSGSAASLEDQMVGHWSPNPEACGSTVSPRMVAGTGSN